MPQGGRCNPFWSARQAAGTAASAAKLAVSNCTAGSQVAARPAVPMPLPSSPSQSQPQSGSYDPGGTPGCAHQSSCAGNESFRSDASSPPTAFQEALPKLSTLMARENFVFLDSANLNNIKLLMRSVEASSTFFLMLTREVLERPVVLAELCCACQGPGRPIVPIILQWPKAAENGRDFRFPADIDAAIYDWSLFDEARKKRVKSLWGMSAKWATRHRNKDDSGRAWSDRTGWKDATLADSLSAVLEALGGACRGVQRAWSALVLLLMNICRALWPSLWPSPGPRLSGRQATGFQPLFDGHEGEQEGSRIWA